jgi:hypothetical protein
MGEEMKVCKVSVRSPEGKRTLGKQGRRWENGIKMDLTDNGKERVESIHLAQERYKWRALVSTMTNLRFVAPRSKVNQTFSLLE